MTASYEDKLQKLNEIVEQLENTQLSLESSVQLYEQGMQLVTECQKYLDASKLRIEKVREVEGKIVSEELIPDADEQS